MINGSRLSRLGVRRDNLSRGVKSCWCQFQLTGDWGLVMGRAEVNVSYIWAAGLSWSLPGTDLTLIYDNYPARAARASVPAFLDPVLKSPLLDFVISCNHNVAFPIVGLGPISLLCCALCCRAGVLAVKWYYSRGSSTAASKEIRIDTRSARKRGGQHWCWSQCCVASLGHPSAKHILDVSSAPSVVTAMSGQHSRGSQPRGKMSMSQYFSSILLSSAFCPQRARVSKHICTDLHFLLKCFDAGNVVTDPESLTSSSHHCARSKSGSYKLQLPFRAPP